MVRSDAPVRVLYVDDQPVLGELAATYLERYEADVTLEVVAVGNAREAQDRVGGSHIDCIVSDYELPETDGLELLEAVRCQYPDIPFILFTGKGSEEVARDAFQVGATDYMQKGPGTDQYTVLAKRIHNAVSQHRAEATSEQYGAAIEALENAVYVLDGEGRLTSVDDVFLEMTGYDREAALGTPISALDADGTLSENFASLVDAEGPDTVQFEADVVSASDEVRRCRCHLTARQFTGESAESVVGVLHELTDLQYYDGLTDLILDTSTTLMSAEADEVDTKLRWTLQSVAEYVGAGRATVFSATEGGDVTSVDVSTGGLDVSVGLEDIEKTHEWCASGITPADATADGCAGAEWWLDQFRRFENVRVESLSSMPPEADSLRERFERQGVTSLIAVPLVSNWSLRGVVEFASHDGEGVWTDREVRLLRTLGDLIAHTLERRRREREMARYKTIIDTVPDGVFLLDEQGYLTQVNEAFASSFGFDADDLTGRPFLDLVDQGCVPPDIADEYVEGIKAMLSGDREKNVFEVEVSLSENVETRVYEAHTRLLPYEDSFRGTAGITRDVTDELHHRAQLRRQNDRLDDFASVVSHDLRNPLNIAQGFLDVARETGDDSYLDRVEGALDRIDRLVGDVLSLARQGQAVGETSQFDLAQSIFRTWAAVETFDASITLTGELGFVTADETRFSQAIENLFRNAVEHGGHDVAIDVGPLTDGSGFYIADDGPGIPPDRRDAVFEHGYTTSRGGTGFGLSIVRTIVEAHNWSVGVTESADGGARFEITYQPAETDAPPVEAESVK
ncbi:PAS domain S-box protein [Halogranum rubrum]|uniref:histidine kinase n=1 Tax=Halogranum salarium B-1 TaxID=1210908 RepID=J3EZG3_9EURY|nr:PAS domain S-box protein [Halogranum salarium]EJN60987.1 hypothetical protein HSB1_00280 [Halogranum salarium B-1]